jgi:poly-gamma-glutamate synthesis protein (capsule biosynthesis protein)
MKTLHETPLDSLKISPFVRGIITSIHFFVKLFGIWKRPKKRTAANFEEMSFIDKVYWAYKSKYLIKLPSEGILTDDFHKGLKYTRHGIKKKGPSIFIGAVGDLIKNPFIQHSGNTLYEHIAKYLFNKDILTANLESLLSETEGGTYEFSTKDTPSLNCTEQQFNILKEFKGQQYSVLNIANNHSLDEGILSFYHTAEKLKQDGISAIGINTSSEEYGESFILEKSGFKIGFISATYGINGKKIDKGHEHAVNIEPFHNAIIVGNNRMGNLERQLKHAIQQGCDFVIAHLHWGYEYELYPRNSQIQKARELADAGVDLIISHHPHVIQPYEIYTPKSAPHKRTLITYSLGNLTSNYNAPGLRLSVVLNVSLLSGIVEEKEGLYIHEVEFIPVVQMETKEGKESVIKIITLKELQGENKEMKEILNTAFRL